MGAVGSSSPGMAAQDGERGVGEQPSAGLFRQLAFEGRPDGLPWFKAASRWSPVAVLEPTTTQAAPMNGTT